MAKSICKRTLQTLLYSYFIRKLPNIYQSDFCFYNFSFHTKNHCKNPNIKFNKWQYKIINNFVKIAKIFIFCFNKYMRILPINASNQRNRTTFTHHPDFDRLIKTEPLTASSYFRRGFASHEVSDAFIDIVNTFKKVFSGNITVPKRVLIVGIADSQEPFSYLTSIRQIVDRPIEEVLDLHTVDLQSAPSHKKLHEDSYTWCHMIPNYAKSGFVRSSDPKKMFYNYRVRDDLFKFLEHTYKNPEKSKWESRIQEVINDYPDNYFDIISMNNVVYYLPEADKFPTLNGIYRAMKKDGYYITEGNYYVEHADFAPNMQEEHLGIFKKVQ